MLEGITPFHLIFILVIAVLVVGPGKLPETGAALGKALRSFREGVNGKPDDPGLTLARITGAGRAEAAAGQGTSARVMTRRERPMT